MPLPLAAAIAIPIMADLIGQGLSNRRQKKQNQLDYTQELDKMNIQRRWALEDWTRETEYNTPKAQKQRLIEAGYNPALMYGQLSGNLAADTRATGPSVTSRPAGKFDISRIGQSLALANDLKTSEENRENLIAQRDLMYAQKLNTEAGTVKTMAETKMSDVQRQQLEAIQTDLIRRAGLENEKLTAETANIDANTLKTNVETDISMDRNAREQMANTANVALTWQKILTEKLEQKRIELANELQPEIKKKLQAEIAQIEAMQMVTITDYDIKQIELKMNKNGIMKTDPIWARTLLEELAQKAREGSLGKK